MKSNRFSLFALFAALAFACLAIALVASRLEIARLKSELSRALPIREIDIVVQVEKATAKIGLPVNTTEIVYDQSGGTYLVAFTYFDPPDGIKKTGSVKLTSQGGG